MKWTIDEGKKIKNEKGKGNKIVSKENVRRGK